MEGVIICLSLMVVVLLREILLVRKGLRTCNHNQVKLYKWVTGETERKADKNDS
jgi:hypothetical protein